MTETEKNQMVHQYEPLVNKLVGQFYKKVQCSWEDLRSYAYEGLALAIAKYDSGRSEMTFTQYAAFSIRNNILTSLNSELRTVKLDAYAQKVVTAQGGTLFNTVSIDHAVTGDDEENLKPRETVMGMVEDEKFSNGDIFDYLYTRLEDKFNKRECEMFYMTFGLKGYDELANKDIAKKFGVSAGLISQKIKKITTWIKSDNDLCEMLSEML